MALPAKVQAQLVDFDEQLSSFEESVKSLERECRGQKQAGLAPEEAAKFNLLMALKVNALYYAFLRTQGVDAAHHPIREELVRAAAAPAVATFTAARAQKRVQDANTELRRAIGELPAAEPAQRKTTVNPEAATRVINAHLARADA